MTTNLLYGLHDRAGHMLVPTGGWVVDAVLVSDTPPSYAATRGDVNWIVRLNFGWNPNGTIPLPDKYANFAVDCARFVDSCPGVTRWIIGNEPNLAGERPEGVVISAEDYARCFKLCRDAIKSVSSQHQVIPAAVAPYNVNTGWCIAYWKRMIGDILSDGDCDGIAIHTYSRGPTPGSVTSENKMAAPYNDYYNGFRAYRDFIEALPSGAAGLPIYITETDQNEPWANENSGWVQAAYKEIDDWNRAGNQIIECLALYRWSGDQWAIEGKGGVMADFRDAVSQGYASPGAGTATIQPAVPRPQPTPALPTINNLPPATQPTMQWDARLADRGAVLDPAVVSEGESVFRVNEGKWFDKEEAQGRTNVFVRVEDADGQLISGVPVLWSWAGGAETKVTEVKHDPWLGDDYSLDFPMYEPAPSYALRVATSPSDTVRGLGLGSIEQPDYKIHTAYYFRFRLTTQTIPEGVTPGPLPIATALCHPVAGANITQHFYQRPEAYRQFNLVGHNGTDFAVPVGTPVRCLAPGVVQWVATDADYGNYCRVYHAALNIHSFYAHLSSVAAQVGQVVNAGQVVAQSGNTGNTTGPHLHFEIRAADDHGDYATIAPMPSGRLDPETFCALHNLRL